MKKKENDIVKTVELNQVTYEIVRNDNDCFDKEVVLSKLTDYFDDYDYILGDFAYDKVRLKGYYDSNNKKANKINDIKYMDDYVKNYCSFGSRIFLLKKVK